MAQAGTVWVSVVPSMRGFVTQVTAETKKIPDAKVRVDPLIDTSVWKARVAEAGRAAGPVHVGIDLDTGAALADLAAFRGEAEAIVGALPSHVDVDTNEGLAQLGRWVAEAYAVAGQIASNVNVDTAEASGRLGEFRRSAEAEIGDLTANVNVDVGRATERVDTFEAETKRKLETITANINVDDGRATERIDTFEANSARKLDSLTANINVDDGRATQRVDAFIAETKRKIETITANVNVDTGRATEKVDVFVAETKRKLESITANIDVDTGRATEKVDAFEAESHRKLDTLTANVDADTGGATGKVDAFEANSHRKLDTITANVDADTGKATGDVDEFDAASRAKLHNITANINADTGRATARIHVWKAEMNRYVNNPITAFPVVNTTFATAEIVAFKAEAQGILDTIHGTATLDFGQAFSGIFGMISGIAQMYLGVIQFAHAWGLAEVGIAGVIALIGSLGPAVFAVVGALALIPALALAAGFGIGTLIIGFNGVGAAISAAFDPTKASEFQAALAKLSPEARKTLLVIQGFSAEIHDLQTKTQDALFAGTADLVQKLGDAYLPLATKGFTAMAAGINLAVKSFGNFLLIPSVMSKLAVAEQNVVAFTTKFAAGSEIWGEAFTTLAAVGSNQLPRIAQGFADAGTAFNSFINQAADTGELDAFLSRSVDELGVFLHLLFEIGVIVERVFTAAGTTGVDLVRILDEGATALADFLGTAEGMSRVTALFEASYASVRNITPLLQAIGAALAGPVWDSFVKDAPLIAGYFGDLAVLVPYVAEGFSLINDAVTGVLYNFDPALVAAVTTLGPLLTNLVLLIFDLANVISRVLTVALYALSGPLELISNFLGGIRASLGDTAGFSAGGVVGRAVGGVIDGYEPGVDRVPVLLSRGEGVLVPEAVRGLGPEFVGWANRHYSGGRSPGGVGTGLGFAEGGLLLKQTIPAPGTGAAAAIGPSLASMRGGGIGPTSPGDYGGASARGGGVTQNNYFNQPLDEQAYAAATLRRLDFAQRMAG